MVHFCPIITRCGQLLAVIMSWKTYNMKLMFLFRNPDLHVKGEDEQGEKNPNLCTASPLSIPWQFPCERLFSQGPSAVLPQARGESVWEKDFNFSSVLNLVVPGTIRLPKANKCCTGRQLCLGLLRETRRRLWRFSKKYVILLFSQNILMSLLPLIVLCRGQSPEGLPSAQRLLSCFSHS